MSRSPFRDALWLYACAKTSEQIRSSVERKNSADVFLLTGKEAKIWRTRILGVANDQHWGFSDSTLGVFSPSGDHFAFQQENLFRGLREEEKFCIMMHSVFHWFPCPRGISSRRQQDTKNEFHLLSLSYEWGDRCISSAFFTAHTFRGELYT